MIKKSLNEQEQEQLFEYLRTSSSTHSDIIALLLLTGIRTHETLSLKIKDLDFVNNTLTVWDAAKGSDGRVLGLPSWFVSRARGKVKESKLGPDGRLLEALGYGGEAWQPETVKAVLRRSWQVVKKNVWGSGVLRLGLHSLRHTFAVKLYKSTRDPLMVQRALGHKSFTSTQKYLVYADEAAQVKAIASLFERVA